MSGLIRFRHADKYGVSELLSELKKKEYEVLDLYETCTICSFGVKKIIDGKSRYVFSVLISYDGNERRYKIKKLYQTLSSSFLMEDIGSILSGFKQG